MPNSKSAAKRVRQTKARTLRHRIVKSRLRTFRKKVEEAVSNGEKESAELGLRTFSSAVDKAAKSNVIHKNAAARYKSSLSKLVGTMGS